MDTLEQMLTEHGCDAETLRAQYETYIKECARHGDAPDDPNTWAAKRIAKTALLKPFAQPELTYERRMELRRAFLRIMCAAGHGTIIERAEAHVSEGR